MKLLTSTDRYLAKLIALPLFSTLVIAAMLLVLEKMLRLFDFVAAEGGPAAQGRAGDDPAHATQVTDTTAPTCLFQPTEPLRSIGEPPQDRCPRQR